MTVAQHPIIRCVVCLVVALAAAVDVSRAQQPKRMQYAIAIHGGAGSDPAGWPQADRDGRTKTLTAALTKGKQILADGGTSLDAVEQVIRILEDDPLFNAGRGAVFNEDGDAQLDASIMDGKTKACGAVGAVETAKNPISLARLVMTKTKHVLLVGRGANEFAKQQLVPLVASDYFKVSQATSADEDFHAYTGTVGCVALDSQGNLAAGTSTGGLTGKKFGRVGDSPIIAAGTYADNTTCAVSCTGIGEHFIRHAIAYDVHAQMAYLNKNVSDAVHLQLFKKLKPGDGGIIAVDKGGNITMQFSTKGMPRAAADSAGKFEVALGPKK